MPKYPPAKDDGPLQLPFVAGVPPKRLNRLIGASDAHKVVLEPVPATGAGVIVTVCVTCVPVQEPMADGLTTCRRISKGPAPVKLMV